MAQKWRVQGVSVQGYRHQQTGTPCQDACHYAVTGSATVLAVADGAGSRPRSDEGSELAVKLAAECFGERADTRSSPGEATRKLLLSAFREVRAEFLRKTGDRPDDFATTLTVVVLTKDWIGHLTVGDGFVVLRAGAEDGKPQYHLLPQTAAVSEYSNETTFLTSPEAWDRVRVDCVYDPGVSGVLLSTDGLAQAALAFQDGGPIAPNNSFVTAVFRSIDSPRPDPEEDRQALATYLRSEQLTRLNADDKTLLRAVRL